LTDEETPVGALGQADGVRSGGAVAAIGAVGGWTPTRSASIGNPQIGHDDELGGIAAWQCGQITITPPQPPIIHSLAALGRTA
jgi:hypothetical protein